MASDGRRSITVRDDEFERLEAAKPDGMTWGAFLLREVEGDGGPGRGVGDVGHLADAIAGELDDDGVMTHTGDLEVHGMPDLDDVHDELADLHERTSVLEDMLDAVPERVADELRHVR